MIQVLNKRNSDQVVENDGHTEKIVDAIVHDASAQTGAVSSVVATTVDTSTQEQQSSKRSKLRKSPAMQMADDLSRAVAMAQLPQVGAMFRLDELTRSLASINKSSSIAKIGYSKMLFEMPELAFSGAFGTDKLVSALPSPIYVHQSPIFDLVSKQNEESEKWRTMLTAKVSPPVLDFGKGIVPTGMASHFDVFPAAKLVSTHSAGIDFIDANLASLGLPKDPYKIGAAVDWARETKTNLFGLSSQFQQLERTLTAINSNAALFQQNLDSMQLGLKQGIALPFLDFRPDFILDPELRSFLSLHCLVEKGLRSLHAYSIFYRGNMKNEVARRLLSAIIARLEYFLEHLELLEGLPVSVFGTMSGIAPHALSDLYEIQSELPAIRCEIESLADFWRH